MEKRLDREMCRAFEGELRKLAKIAAHPDADQFMRLMTESRQPALTELLVAQFIEAMPTTPEEDEAAHTLPFFCLLIKVMIDELDRALRA